VRKGVVVLNILPDKEIVAVYVSKDGYYLSFRESNGMFTSFVRMNNSTGVAYKEKDLDAPIQLLFEYGPKVELERKDNL
jgi:hypothetical protein